MNLTFEEISPMLLASTLTPSYLIDTRRHLFHKQALLLSFADEPGEEGETVIVGPWGARRRLWGNIRRGGCRPGKHRDNTAEWWQVVLWAALPRLIKHFLCIVQNKWFKSRGFDNSSKGSDCCLTQRSGDSSTWWKTDSQCEILSFLPHNADSAFFGQDRRVLVTDFLVEQHVGVPVSPPYIGVRVGCTQRHKSSLLRCRNVSKQWIEWFNFIYLSWVYVVAQMSDFVHVTHIGHKLWDGTLLQSTHTPEFHHSYQTPPPRCRWTCTNAPEHCH